MKLSPDLLDPIIEVEYSIEKSIKNFIKDLIIMLKDFKISCKVIACTPSESLALVKLRTNSIQEAIRVTKLSSEIAKCMCADAVRLTNFENRVNLEIASQFRPKLQLKRAILSQLFWGNGNPIVPLGLSVAGRISMLNLNNIDHLAIVGDCAQNKTNLIHCWLISMIYQDLPVSIIIFNSSNKYQLYQKIDKISFNKIEESKDAICILDTLDQMDREDLKFLLKSKMKIIAIVNDINRCDSLIKEYFYQQILFKLSEGRRYLIGKQFGADYLLPNNDILYITQKNVSRFQTISVSYDEVMRVTRAVRTATL